MYTDTERILLLWDFRPCFVCGNRGPCVHRELDVAQAEIEREDLRIRRRQVREEPIVSKIRRVK